MGKTSKPTRLLIHPSLVEWPEIKALAAQGHEVVVSSELAEFDIVLGPNCWMMDALLQPYFVGVALPAARKRADARKKS